MTITNGYTTLDNLKSRMAISSADPADDAVLEAAIEEASRIIDRETLRTFYARTETRKFNVPQGRELWLDDDLLTVTTLTNGDGTTIANTEYTLRPVNGSYFWAIRLKESSSVGWGADANGNSEGVIQVAGTWGRTSTAPRDIRLYCEDMAVQIYHARYGEGSGAGNDGKVLTTLVIPAGLYAYRRLV